MKLTDKYLILACGTDTTPHMHVSQDGYGCIPERHHTSAHILGSVFYHLSTTPLYIAMIGKLI